MAVTGDDPTALVGREPVGDWTGAAAAAPPGAAAGVCSGEAATGEVTLGAAPAVTSDVVAWELAVRESGAVEVKLEVLAVGEVFNPMFAIAVFKPETWDGPGLLIG